MRSVWRKVALKYVGSADLFSFGVVLYEEATGQTAFARNNPALIFVGILHKAPPSPVPWKSRPTGRTRAHPRQVLEKRDVRC
jgi:hypothetical protein